MTGKLLFNGLGALLLLVGGIANAGPIDQSEACVNVDGDIYDVGPGCFYGAGGNITDDIDDDGLGTVTVIVTEAGDHDVDMYVNWEIDFLIDFVDEYGGTGGAAAAGQTWEIDESGFFFGDIFDNFLVGMLDNSNGVPAGFEDDVSLALGWDFTLLAGQMATIEFLLSDMQPDSGLWLQHVDPASDYSFYFSSTLTIVPERGTLWLLGAGLLGLGLVCRRNLTGG